MIDGAPVDDDAFGRAVERVRAAVAGLPAALGDTTQFEVLTVAAFLAMAEAGVQAAAVEAGLGGRLDATNVLRAPVVVLTNVALEHTEVLGRHARGDLRREGGRDPRRRRRLRAARRPGAAAPPPAAPASGARGHYWDRELRVAGRPDRTSR